MGTQKYHFVSHERNHWYVSLFNVNWLHNFQSKYRSGKRVCLKVTRTHIHTSMSRVSQKCFFFLHHTKCVIAISIRNRKPLPNPQSLIVKIHHALYPQISFLTCCHAMSSVDDAHRFSYIDIDRLDYVSEKFAMMNQNSARFLLMLSTMHVVYSKLVIFGDSIPSIGE